MTALRVQVNNMGQWLLVETVLLPKASLIKGMPRCKASMHTLCECAWGLALWQHEVMGRAGKQNAGVHHTGLPLGTGAPLMAPSLVYLSFLLFGQPK